MKRALICGVSGQDGAYLSKFLLEKGYVVYGTSRDAQTTSFRNLECLGILERVNLESMAPSDFRSVLQILAQVEPDEIYNLAGQTSVGLSFQQPVETLESISIGTLNLLEAVRFLRLPVRVYNAGSCECFGETGSVAADENTAFRPRSPYGVAKAAAFWQVANYREAYGIYGCSGILFNHESPFRPERFVTQKIVGAACRIADGEKTKLVLGNIKIERDWGWAPEYVEAMWLMLQQTSPDDYVIATGKAGSLADFVEEVFRQVGLDWRAYTVTDKALFRPTDISVNLGCPDKAKKILGWEAKHKFHDVARMMVEARCHQVRWARD